MCGKPVIPVTEVCGKPVIPVTEGVVEGEKSFHLDCYRLYKRPKQPE